MEDFKNSINIGLHHIYELCGNLVNISVRLDQEIDINYNGHKIYLNTLEKSSIIFEYSIFETLVSFLSYFTLRLNERAFSNAPKIKFYLTTDEVNSLVEKEIAKVDKDKSIRKHRYQSTSEKLENIPVLFMKLFGHTVKIEKGNSNWEKYKHLEKLRHSLIHPKFDNPDLPLLRIDNTLIDFNSLQPTVMIKTNDLFDGHISLRWYIRFFKEFVERINDPELRILAKGLEIIDSFLFMSMVSISKYCGKTEMEIAKLFPR